jgi:iron complex transport system substrate-binding protein
MALTLQKVLFSRKGRRVLTERTQRVDIDRLSYTIIGAALRIHSRLGPGLFESVYEEVLADDLTRRGFHLERQKHVPIVFDDRYFQKGYRADLIVERSIVLEIKSIERIAPVHIQQLVTYLRLADYRLGLLLNFGESSLKNGIKRVVNRL